MISPVFRCDRPDLRLKEYWQLCIYVVRSTSRPSSLSSPFQRLCSNIPVPSIAFSLCRTENAHGVRQVHSMETDSHQPRRPQQYI